MRHARVAFATGLIVAAVALPASAKITLELDYSLDTNNFFNPNTANGQAARTALQFAADTFSDRFLDQFAAVGDATVAGAPNLLNDWTPRVTHPGTGQQGFEPGINQVAANTVKVYAGGRDLPGSTLGLGGGGGAGFFYYEDSWYSATRSRGQLGVVASPPTDHAPWGGAITFDTATNWNFNVASAPSSGSQSDFLSVALHELAHLLGFASGATPPTSFSTYVSGNAFIGAKSKALNGGANVPMTDGSHLSGSLTSTVTGADSQQPAMSPSILQGTRKRFTVLDWAVLDDIGWELAKPGDANADGNVNFDDLLALAQNYNASNRTWSEGDFNYTGTVNFDDLLKLAQAYGSSGPLAVTGASPEFAADWAMALSLVPEPATMGVLGLAGAVFTRRRRR